MTTQHLAKTRDDGRLLVGERRVLELIATGAPLTDVLAALCRVIDEESGLRSSIFLLDHGGTQLSLAAGPHLPDVWSRALHTFPATPTTTACGLAVSRREQVIVTDVPNSPLYEPWVDAVRASQISAVWSTPFFSKDGRVLGTFAVYDDESRTPDDEHLRLVERATRLASIAVERHHTEESLRESEVRFSRAFYASPACMTITRFADGRFLTVNDSFVRMFGYSREEAIGQTALGLGLYADPKQRPIMMQLLAERTLHDVEVKARTKSGAVLDLVLSMEHVEIQGEDCVLQIATDITARKRAEEALRASEKRWRSVFDNSAIGIKMGDATLRVIAANRALQELGGYSERELTALTFLDLTYPDDRHLVLEATGDLLAGEARERQMEKRYLRKDGSIIWVRGTISVIRETNESPQFLVLVEDISARKAAERELQESVDQMRALTARTMRTRRRTPAYRTDAA